MLVCWRGVFFKKRCWKIFDQVISDKDSLISFCSNFNTSQNVEIKQEKNSTVFFIGKSVKLNANLNNVSFSKEESEYAPSYGLKKYATRLKFETKVSNKLVFDIQICD